MDGTIAPAELDFLNEAQDDEQHRDHGEDIRSGKALKRADDGHDRAHERENQQSERVDSPALNEGAKSFLIEAFHSRSP